jgi:hypothetical protein
VGNQPLAKVGAATAAEICLRFDAPRDVRALLRNEMGPREFLEALAAGKQYADAIDFLAHALPAREGTWWGGLCLQHAWGDALTPQERAAGIAAVRWVIQPTEENRVAARAPADAAGVMSPAGLLAFSANGGLMPGPYGSAKTVAMAVKLAVLKSPPAGIVETQRLYLELGIGVAEGTFA